MAQGNRSTREGGPVSVVLPVDLKARIQAEARKRGLKLSPVIRVLVSERIHQIDESAGLTRAEEWQRAQAWATWERLRAGDRREVSKSQIDADFGRALRRRQRSRAV